MGLPGVYGVQCPLTFFALFGNSAKFSHYSVNTAIFLYDLVNSVIVYTLWQFFGGLTRENSVSKGVHWTFKMFSS